MRYLRSLVCFCASKTRLKTLCALVCAVSFVLFCQVSWTQPFSVTEHEPSATATLDITVYQDEFVDVSLWYDPTEGEWITDDAAPLPASWQRDWASVLQATLSCTGSQFNEFSAEMEDGYLSAHGLCPALTSKGTQWQGSTDLSPLLDALSEIDVESLNVWVSLPEMGNAQVFPVGDSPYADHNGSGGWILQRFVPEEYSYSIDVSNPDVTQISYSYGFTPQQVMRRLIVLGLLLLLPLVIVYWLRSRTLRLHAQSPEKPLWFGYQRSLNWLSIALWILWLLAAFGTQLSDWLPMLLFSSPHEDWTLVFNLVTFMLPPTLVELAINALSYPVTKQVGKLDYSRSESFALTAATKGIIFFPLLLLALAWPMFQGNPLAVGLGTAVFLGFIVSFVSLQKLRDWTPHAITTGELRDRIFQLAKPTGIELKQIYLLPMKRSRMVNAFALKNNTVMVTDYLLKQLSKAEVDGIMAHELAHLQLGHPKKLGVRLFIFFGLAFWIIPIASSAVFFFITYSFGLQIILSFAVFYIVFYGTSRKFEYQADAQAALITGDPQALITGLTKIAYISQMPLQWGKWGEKLMTHPSMQRRVEAIAKRYDIADDALNALLKQAKLSIDSTSVDGQILDRQIQDSQVRSRDRYNVDKLIAVTSPAQIRPGSEDTEAQTGQALLFSTQFKQKTSSRLVWLIWLCFSLGPVILGRLVYLLPTPGTRWIGYGCAAIAIIGFYFYILNTSPTHVYPKLLSQFAQRLKAKGFEPKEGAFVGLAPSAEARNYEGHTVWDIGWLHLASDRLYYIGEQMQFALTTQQVTRLELKKEAANFIPSAVILLTWQDKDLTPHTFRLQPLEAKSLNRLQSVARSLTHKLEDWHIGKQTDKRIDTPAHTPANDSLQSLQPPVLRDITSAQMPKLSFSLLLMTWLMFILVAFAIAAITGSLTLSLPLTLFIFTLPTIGALLQMWPALKRTLSLAK